MFGCALTSQRLVVLIVLESVEYVLKLVVQDFLFLHNASGESQVVFFITKKSLNHVVMSQTSTVLIVLSMNHPLSVSLVIN